VGKGKERKGKGRGRGTGRKVEPGTLKPVQIVMLCRVDFGHGHIGRSQTQFIQWITLTGSPCRPVC
jgi:hypothetical protein